MTVSLVWPRARLNERLLKNWLEPSQINREDCEIQGEFSSQAMDRDIARELQQVLASEHFRNAKRSRDFLSYVVTNACTGNAELLKERTLGVELFGRAASYDTGEDAIVRVKACEVRRRLAQYEVSADPSRAIRILLPPGSYVPHFMRAAAKPEPIEPLPYEGSPLDFNRSVPQEKKDIRRRSIFIRRVIPCFIILLALFMYGTYARRPRENPLKEFWGPLIQGREPLLICIGYPTVYLPVNGEQRDVNQSSGSAAVTSASFSPAQPGGEMNVVGVPHAFVGIGDSDAGFLIGRTLQSFGKPSQIRMGSDTSLSELRSSQVVLIGAYSNKWTMLMTENLRFSFVEKNKDRMIVDREKPNQFWDDPSLSTTGKTSFDYALVSRIYNPSTRQIVISVAGISRYGSQAAAEYFTDPTSVATILHMAPSDWKGRNLQVVLRTKVVEDIPDGTEVIATHFW